MANYFDTGILLTAGFSLSSQAPLDGRSVVELLTDLDTHIAENRAYEGMCVYVKENKKIYIYNGTTWEEFVGGGSPEKQIKDWVSGSNYLEGDYIYHEGEMYRCLASNNDVDFDETNWKQLTYGIDELSKEDVEGLLGLTEEEIEAMADLILDTEVRIDKTYSSSKIHADIQQCLQDSKDFTLGELGRKIGASYEVVTSTDDMVSQDYLYLLNNGNGYDIYIVDVDNIPVVIGGTTIDLSGYYTKEEVDNDFLKKSEAVLEYATKVELESELGTETLNTTAQTIKGAVNELFQSVSNGKGLIASAITDKGINTSDTDTFETMANNIANIRGGGGNVNERVENIKIPTVPIMSSNASDDGEVIFSSEQQYYEAFRIFNTNSSNFWMSASNKTTDEWIGVKYTTPQIITEIIIVNAKDSFANAIKNFRVEGSNDGVDYDVLYTGENTNNAKFSEWSVTFRNDKEYLYYRIYVIDGFATADVRIGKMSLRKDVIISEEAPLIPKMTSNTTPSGVASASSVYSSFEPYKAFGKNYPSDTEIWVPNASDLSPWIQYEFDTPQIVQKVGIHQPTHNSTANHALKTYELLGSNDGITFDSLGYGGILPAKLGTYKSNTFNNSKSYKIYRIKIIDTYDRAQQVYLGDVQLYG